MVRNNIITKILIIFTLPILGFITFSLINQSNNIKPITSQVSVDEKYTIDIGIEEESKSAAIAVKNYATQDINESKIDRNIRLGQFFTGDSPIYNYKNNLTTSKINKTTAEIISVKNQNTEGNDLNLEVKTLLTLYEKSKTTTSVKTFWISLTKTHDGLMVPYNIGEIK